MLTRKYPPDLYDLISKDVILHWVSGTRGGEFSSPFCPICGEGTDRLRVQPEMNLWWCRKCGDEGRMDHWDNDIGWLRKTKGFSFKQACDYLGIEVTQDEATSYNQSKKNFTFPDPQPIPPDKQWQDLMYREILIAHTRLLDKNHITERSWLYNKRGITEATIREFKLGWTDNNRFVSNYNPDEKAFCIPSGLLIPLYAIDSALWGLKIRLDPDLEGKRYTTVKGTKACLTGKVSKAKTLLLVEGELDMMIAWQECHTSLGIDVATYGGAQTSNLHDYWYTYFRQYDNVYIWFDQDNAGRNGAQKIHTRLDQELFYGTNTKIHNIYYPEGWIEAYQCGPLVDTLKDVTDLYLAGLLKPFLHYWLKDKQ